MHETILVSSVVVSFAVSMFLFLPHAIFQFLDSISPALDPVEWIFNTGKELERSCDFAMALKYYFAGRMFFARLKQHAQHANFRTVPEQLLKKWDTHKYEQEFQALYVDLLPMTNAQVRLRNDNATRSPVILFFEHHFTTVANPVHPGLLQRSRVRPLPKGCTQARYHEQMKPCASKRARDVRELAVPWRCRRHSSHIRPVFEVAQVVAEGCGAQIVGRGMWRQDDREGNVV